MKKVSMIISRWLLIVAIAAVLSATVFAVQAEQILCPCGCGASLADVQWEAWSGTVDADGGHYRMEADYLYAQTEQITVAEGCTVALDLNGNTVTVTGSGELSGFDTSNDDYDGCGTAVVTDVQVSSSVKAPNNGNYIAITDENGTSFHRLENKISSVALRPSADGVKMRVCNVYYSGCKLYQHYNWWISGEAPYQFFETTVENGRVQTNNVTLEWCLAQGEWDYISMQTASSTTASGDPEVIVAENKLYLDTFVNYFREQFPKAQLAWHQTWSYAVGTAGNGTVTTAETQVANHERNKAVADIICETYELLQIRSGDAWKIIRDGGYDKLCARIGQGTNHEGDYYHDGDIGGGQYLNACVWYETITGNSVVGNTYRPVYTYGGEEISLNSEITYVELQEAAHQAVQNK